LRKPSITAAAAEYQFWTGATPIEIDTRSVSAVRAAFPGEYAPGVQSVLSLGKTRQGVREDVAAVTTTLRAHGAKI
jgi:hypothetical protein